MICGAPLGLSNIPGVKLVSLHIRSMWETICDAWACWSGWNFGPNSEEYPLPLPSPENWNLGRSWHFNLSVSESPPPPCKLKFSQILALWLFSPRILFSFRISHTNGKLCVASYHMWRLYPARITTRFSWQRSKGLQASWPWSTSLWVKILAPTTDGKTDRCSSCYMSLCAICFAAPLVAVRLNYKFVTKSCVFTDHFNQSNFHFCDNTNGLIDFKYIILIP